MFEEVIYDYASMPARNSLYIKENKLNINDDNVVILDKSIQYRIDLSMEFLRPNEPIMHITVVAVKEDQYDSLIKKAMYLLSDFKNSHITKKARYLYIGKKESKQIENMTKEGINNDYNFRFLGLYIVEVDKESFMEVG